MDPKLQLILSLGLGFFGALALWTGTLTLNGPEGLGPERKASGLAARLVGVVLLASAAAFFHSSEMGLVLFLLAVVIATAVCRGRG